MDFLKDFNKISEKIDGVSMESVEPKYWISTGNYIINKIISGKYKRGIPQGRLAGLCGPSGAGKSFLTGNIVRSAQEQGLGVIVIDSENALDNLYMKKIGVNVDDPAYIYRGLGTIDSCTKIVSNFIKSYRKHNETRPFLIVIDSLDMLATESGLRSYTEDGEIKPDFGLHPKQIKLMLANFMHSITDLNMSILCTKQVYKNQNAMEARNAAAEWIMTDSAMFPFSQVAQVTRLMVRDDTTKAFEGITLKVFGKKTRFTKPYQWAKVEVPYDTGMDAFSGVLEAAKSLGIVELNGAWYSFNGQKFQSKNFDQFKNQILDAMCESEELSLKVQMDDAIEDTSDDDKPSDISKKRNSK